MTTDITELAQMKGQKVEGSYYLAECTDCGKMYPSNKLNGGEPLFSGDYGECYCPHCNADDAAIGDCGDTAAIAWNYQQGRIDALVEALEKAQAKNALVAGGIEAATKLHERIAELESQVKFPGVMRCNTCGFSRSHVIVTPGGMLAGESEPEHCPNGCGPLWHETYRRQYNELYDAYKELESRTVKIPGWFVKDAIAVYDRDEIEEALSAAGIKWEAE